MFNSKINALQKQHNNHLPANQTGRDNEKKYNNIFVGNYCRNINKVRIFNIFKLYAGKSYEK
jgi:hypothetical protein